MKLEQLDTLDVISQFLEGTQAVAFSVATTKQERYRWIQGVKLYGYTHIPQQYAADFTALNSDQVYQYVNFHHPCYFPTTVTDSKGKQEKKYLYDDMMKPYEKLRALPCPGQHLKSGVTFEALDAFMAEMTDNEAAEQLNSARNQLFKQLHDQLKIEA